MCGKRNVIGRGQCILKITSAKAFIKYDEKARNPEGNKKFFKPIGNVILRVVLKMKLRRYCINI